MQISEKGILKQLFFFILFSQPLERYRIDLEGFWGIEGRVNSHNFIVRHLQKISQLWFLVLVVSATFVLYNSKIHVRGCIKSYWDTSPFVIYTHTDLISILSRKLPSKLMDFWFVISLIVANRSVTNFKPSSLQKIA